MLSPGLIHTYASYRLLVGAPRAGPLSMQKAKVPGGLYNCDFTNPSETCERVNFDNDGKPILTRIVS